MADSPEKEDEKPVELDKTEHNFSPEKEDEKPVELDKTEHNFLREARR